MNKETSAYSLGKEWQPLISLSESERERVIFSSKPSTWLGHDLKFEPAKIIVQWCNGNTGHCRPKSTVDRGYRTKTYPGICKSSIWPSFMKSASDSKSAQKTGTNSHGGHRIQPSHLEFPIQILSKPADLQS